MTLYVWGSNSDFWSSRTDWTPTGTPNAVTDEAEFTTPGGYTVTVDPSQEYLLDALVLDDPDAELDVRGTLRFAGVDNTLALDAGTLLLDSGGVIQGATIESNGGSLGSSGGTFDAVTYQGELDIPENATLTTLDGLTVETAGGAPGGSIVFAYYNSTLNVTGGLTVGTAASPGSIALDNESDTLNFGDSETLDDVSLTLGGYDDSIDSEFNTLTFGTDATVTLSGENDFLYGSFINAGSISITNYTYGENYDGSDSFQNLGSLGVSGNTFIIYQSSFDNQGSLTVSSGEIDVESGTFTNEGDIDVGDGGTLYISANTDFTNTGSLTVEDGGTLDLQYPLTLTQLENSGITVAAGGMLEISGSLDLGGGILDITATGLFSDVLLTSGGTIATGTIVADDGGTFSLAGNTTFDGITYQGELDIPDSTELTALDGLTVETAAGAPGSTIALGESSTLNVTGGLTVGTAASLGSIELDNYDDTLGFGDSETLDDVAITLSGGQSGIYDYYNTLTFGADATVTILGYGDYLYGSLVNAGRIGVTGGYTNGYNYGGDDSFQNLGSLGVSNASFTISQSGFDNQGSLTVDNGEMYIYSATFTNEGDIDVGDGGTLYISANTDFTNTGSLTVEDGGTLDLQYPLTLTQLENSGITIAPGGVLEISGSLDLGGGILDIASTGLFGDLVLASNGTIANGIIVPDGGTLTLADGATFDGITYQGELDTPEGANLYTLDGLTVETAAGAPGGTIVFAYGSNLNVIGGLTVGTAARPGSIELGINYANLIFDDTETLNDVTITLSASQNGIFAYYDGTLTFGADTTVDLTGPQDYLLDDIINLGSVAITAGYTSAQNDRTGNSTFDNQASISVTNGTLDVSNTTFSNEGSIDVGNGGLLEIYANTFTSTGAITVESGGTLDLQTDLTLAQLESSGITVETGGTLDISGSLDLGGGILDIADTGLFSDIVLSGTIANGTIMPDGGTFPFAYGATFDGITYRGELDIPATFALNTLDGLTVETATGAPGGTIVFGYGATLNVTGGLTVGTAGNLGSIELENDNDALRFNDSETLDDATLTLSGYGEQIETYYYTLTLGTDTTVDLSSSNDYLLGSIVNLGSIGVTAGYTYTYDYFTSTFDNQGSLSVANGALYVSNSTFSNEGQITIGLDGDLYISSQTTFTSSGTILITDGGTLEIDTTTAANVTYDDPASLILDQPTTYTGTLSGFSIGDTLQLDGQDIASASITGTTLTVDLVGGGTLTYTTGPDLDGGAFVVSQGSDRYQDLLTYVGQTAGAFVWTAGSGFWSDPDNWTPTGVPDAATAAADIIQPGTYTVIADANTTFALDQLVLDNANAELDVQGTIDFDGIDNTLALIAGTLLADSGGVIRDATIEADGGVLAVTNGTFDAVTWQGELDVPEGTLNVENGLTVETTAGTPGGTLVLDYAASLNVTGGLTVGTAASPGSIELENEYATLSFADSETLDDAAVTLSGYDNRIDTGANTLTFGADATMTLDGSDEYLDGSFINAGSIGLTGGSAYIYTGSFDNQGTLSVTAGSLYVGNASVSNEGVVVVGDDGLLTIDSTLLAGTGSVFVQAGGTLDVAAPTTLSQLEDNGIVIAEGGELQIGGRLDLQGGTMDVAPTGLFSYVLVSGTIANGTILSDGGALTLQYATFDGITYQGVLEVDQSTSLTTRNGLTVLSADGTQPGTITVDYGAALYVTGGLTVGSLQLNADYAEIAFDDSETLSNATVAVGGFADYIYSQVSTLTFGAGTTMDLSGNDDNLIGNFVNAGSIGVTAGYTTAYAYYSGATFDNRGSLTVSNAKLSIEETTVTNEGHIAVGAGGDLYINATTFTSSDAILVGNGGTLEIVPATAADITYDDPANVILDDPADYTGTLSGFSGGDTLQLDGQDVASAGIVGTTLTVVLQGGGDLTYTTGPGLDGVTFSVSDGTDGYQDLLTVVCFLAGTRILTAQGEVAVEDLRDGDMVVTRDAGGEALEPVRWIGRRQIDTAAHPRPADCRPIRIRRDAIAPGQPHRDLLVSPDHALFLDGVLIPAKLLVNGMTIVQDDSIRHVEYFHVELDRHAILVAEGLETESYLDTGNRAIFQNAGLAVILHPAFSIQAGPRRWDAHACAPLATGQAAVEPVWRHLAARAAALGYVPPAPVAMTADPDLRLAVAGRVLRPVAQAHGRCVFALPRGAVSALLCSRAASPAAFAPFHEDRRHLGVAVRRLRQQVRGAERFREIALDQPELGRGWWAAEQASGALWRWTDGAAHIPLAADATLLEVTLHGTLSYAVQNAPEARAVAA